MRFILHFLLALVLAGCGCGTDFGSSHLKIGVDPSWYPLDLGLQQSYLNGFTEDFLMEVAFGERIQFERVSANWDTLLDGLKEKKYDAILTSLPPYGFNEAKYDFSSPILRFGPVLIVAADSKETDLTKMNENLIGFVANSSSEEILQKYPNVMIRPFPSIAEMLDAVAGGEIDGALMDRIPAVNYVNDLYGGKLKIGSAPLNEAGIRLVALKGKHERLIKSFDQSLNVLVKKQKLDPLLKKWNLY